MSTPEAPTSATSGRQDGESILRRVWNPALGTKGTPHPGVPSPATVQPDGTVERRLWASSAGPCRTDPGGAGGQPEGRSMPIRKDCWD
jgi:hypothetical protein